MTWKDRNCCYCNLTAHQPISSQQRCILLPITKHPTSSSLNYRPYSMERSVQKQCFNYSTKQCTRHNIPVGQPTNHSEPCINSCTMPGCHYASQLTHNGTLQSSPKVKGSITTWGIPTLLEAELCWEATWLNATVRGILFGWWLY